MQRRYAPPQAAFITSTIKALEKVNAVFRNPQSRWASPALAVDKTGPDKFRFTVDLRARNSVTMPVASAMPDMEFLLQSTAGSKFFAKLDMCHAYWQIPLHPDSQEALSFQTPIGVFTPTCALQGSTYAGNHFQSSTSKVFSEIQSCWLQWQDDFLMHEESEVSLLAQIRRFFELCLKFGLKLHAKKVSFFQQEAKFCGRIPDEDGVRYDPRGLDTLMHMRVAEMASDLQQFLCATNWMRNSIPCNAEVVAPLHRQMEDCYAKVRKRTKRAVKNLSLHGLWGDNHSSSFKMIQTHLAEALKISSPKEGYTMCLFSDASDTQWALILTQVPSWQRDMQLETQDHEPLSFQSGSFTGSAANWSIIEKEVFAVVESMSCLEYLTAAHEVSLFTDNANLVFILDTFGKNPSVNQNTASKLMRWALKLSANRYVIEHPEGNRNVWSDMLTRWAAKPRDQVQRAKLSKLVFAPISPSAGNSFDWPTFEDIQDVQRNSKEKPPKRFSERSGLIQNKEEVIWIPRDAEDLKIRILVAAHSGIGGHRGIAPTTKAVTGDFY